MMLQTHIVPIRGANFIMARNGDSFVICIKYAPAPTERIRNRAWTAGRLALECNIETRTNRPGSETYVSVEAREWGVRKHC